VPPLGSPLVTPDPFAALIELPEVFEAVDAARGSVDALMREVRTPALRRRVAEVTVESLRRGAWASACMQDPDVSATWDLAGFTAPFAERAGAVTARGALRVSTELSGLADVWSRAPLQALARLHTLAAADLVDESVLGRPRTGADVPARLAGLADLVTSPTPAPAVVVSAVVLGELLALEPFDGGNGLVARAAARLVLLSRGLDPLALSIPEQGLLELGADRTARHLSGYLTGTPQGVGQWIVHWAQAVALGGRAGRAVAADVAQRVAPQLAADVAAGC